MSKNLLVKLLLVLNLAGLGLLLIGSMINVSPTSDEPPHLLSGYTALKFGQNYHDPEHPLLVKTIAAFPLLFENIRYNQNDPNLVNQQWNFDVGKMFKGARSWLNYQGNNPDQILFSSRIPMVLLTIFFGKILFLFTKKLFGSAAALLATFLYATEPIILANGNLIDTDIAAMGWFLTTIFALYLYSERHSPKRLGLLILTLAAALLSKFSMVYLLPIVLALMVYFYYRDKKFLWQHLLFLVLGVFAIISLFYGVISFRKEGLAGFFPFEWLVGLGMVTNQVSDSARFSYLFGKSYYGSLWYYFPALVFTKTQILTLLGSILGIFYLWKKQFNLKLPQLVLIFSPALIFFAVALTAKLNIGLRHVLPIYPFLIMLSAAGYVTFFNVILGVTKNLNVKIVLTFLIATLFVGRLWSVATTYPNFLSYYNFTVGGTDNGWKVADDSNYDWGQDVKRLADWVKANNIKSIALDNYSGVYAADYYNIPYTLMGPEKTNYKGYVALSASVITYYEDKSYSYSWLINNHQPLARAGKSIFIYKID